MEKRERILLSEDNGWLGRKMNSERAAGEGIRVKRVGIYAPAAFWKV